MKSYQQAHNLSGYSDVKYAPTQQKSPINISLSKEKLLEKSETSTSTPNQPLKELHRNQSKERLNDYANYPPSINKENHQILKSYTYKEIGMKRTESSSFMKQYPEYEFHKKDSIPHENQENSKHDLNAAAIDIREGKENEFPYKKNLNLNLQNLNRSVDSYQGQSKLTGSFQEKSGNLSVPQMSEKIAPSVEKQNTHQYHQDEDEAHEFEDGEEEENYQDGQDIGMNNDTSKYINMSDMIGGGSLLHTVSLRSALSRLNFP